MLNLKRYRVLIEKRGKCQWLIIRADVDGRVVAPRGWVIVRSEEIV